MTEAYGVQSYTWDEAGRLTSIDQGMTNLASYTYDPQNQRFSKTVSSTTTYYVYAGGKLLGEYTSAGALIREYVYFNGRPLAQVENVSSSDEITYFHVDHLGTPRVGTDDTGASVWSWSYLGNAFGDIAPTGSVTVNLRMAGQYYDSESDLFYNWNRYYDPETGRYVSSDPIGLGGGLNTFAYAGANPALYIDPEGLTGLSLPFNSKCFLKGGCSIGMTGYTRDGRSVSGQVEPGSVTLPDGTEIDVYRALPNTPAGLATNCHGDAWLDGDYWLNKPVRDLIEALGYPVVEDGSFEEGDIIVFYDEEGGIAHSATVSSVIDGQVYIDSVHNAESDKLTETLEDVMAWYSGLFGDVVVYRPE